jgi:hypothetical protein
MAVGAEGAALAAPVTVVLAERKRKAAILSPIRRAKVGTKAVSISRKSFTSTVAPRW